MPIIQSVKTRLQSLPKPDLSAGLLCFFSFLIWFSLLTYKYYHFAFHDWDLALYSQAMWNLTHGSLQPSLFGTNFLTNHAHYFSFVIAPIYAVFRHPLTLIALQTLSYSAGGFLLYVIAKEFLDWKLAITLLIIYLTFPANWFVLNFEFHFESLAIGLLFLLYYLYQRKNVTAFLITALLTCLIKENLPMVIVAFGLFGLTDKSRNRILWGLAPILIGGGIFYLSMFVITPSLRAEAGITTANQYIGMYYGLGESPKAITQTFVTQPQRILAPLFESKKLKYLWELFGGLTVLPLFSPHILFLGLPIFLQNMLSPIERMHTIYFHYSATLIPIVFLAGIHTIRYIKNRARPFLYKNIIPVLGLCSIFHVFGFLSEITNNMSSWNDRLDPARSALVKQIPKSASVISTFQLLDHLSHRDSLYSFFDVGRDINLFTGETPFRPPVDLQYALIDFKDNWLWGELALDPAFISNIKNFYFRGDWVVQSAVQNIVLLKKSKDGEKLLEVQKKPFKNAGEVINVLVDDKFYLSSFKTDEFIRLSPDHADLILPFTFYWKAKEAPIEDLYILVTNIARYDKSMIKQHNSIGYLIYPTSQWKKGEYIKERYWLQLPKMLPGNYSIQIHIYNITKDKYAVMTYNLPKGPKKGNKFFLKKLTIK